MLDQMSQLPGPTRKEACRELKYTLDISYNNSNPMSEFMKYCSKNYINYIIENEIYAYQEGDLGSQTGWICYLKNLLLERICNEIKSFVNKKKRLFIVIKCIGKFMLLYRKSIEKRYAPGGDFEREAIKYWNPLLWNLSPNDTVKYISYINNKKFII